MKTNDKMFCYSSLSLVAAAGAAASQTEAKCHYDDNLRIPMRNLINIFKNKN
jgi:hypothetical protein